MNWEDTYNPYSMEERTKPITEGWIFTQRLQFSSGLSNSSVSAWEKYLAEISFKAGQEDGYAAG